MPLVNDRICSGSRLTIGNTLVVEVGLGGSEFYTNEFEIDFVFGVTKNDEGRDNTSTSGGGKSSLSVAIPHVVGRRNECSNCVFGHGKPHLAIIIDWLAR